MTYKLLPCPFCGGTPILELFNDGFFDYARIRCCRVMFDWCGDETGEQAIAAWNRRAGDDTNVATNADRIRSMSDEELARFLGDEPPYFSTYEKYLDWLKQPVKEEGHHEV